MPAVPPMFWPLPASFLTGASAAAGIAAINSLGNLSGFAGPFAIGEIDGRWKTKNVEGRPWLRIYRRRRRRSGYVFLHINDLKTAGIDLDQIRVGDRFTFDIASTRDGKTKASNIRLA